MELKLKGSGDGLSKKSVGYASEEEIARKAALGYIHIKCDGVSYFLDINDEYDRQRVQEKCGAETYKWFKETTGDLNWVLYNPKHYKIAKDREDRNILKLNTSEYDGTELQTPINASSMCGMFSWMEIPSNIKFGKRFKLNDIKDMSLLFSGCRIPKDLDLTPILSTKYVESIRYMFYKSIIPQGFKFPEKFNTENVHTMEYMFAQTKIPDGFEINLRTDSLTDCTCMFLGSTFAGKCKFGENFDITDDIYSDNMFDRAVIGGVTIPDNSEYDHNGIIRLLSE